MRKILVIILAAMLLCFPAEAMAVDSRGNTDIPQTEVTEIVPKVPGAEIPPPPVVSIGGDTPEIGEMIEEFQTTYRLTIYYIYLDGSTAAETYSAPMDAGTEYRVPSPEIALYTPTQEVVSGIMPKRNVEHTVIYIPGSEGGSIAPGSDIVIPFIPEETITIDDYGTPLGLGFTIMHVGICID